MTLAEDDETLWVMTLAAVQKMTSRLTRAQKLKLAEQLFAESGPALPTNPTMEEIQRRGDEVISGKAKTISLAEFESGAKQQLARIRKDYAKRPRQ